MNLKSIWLDKENTATLAMIYTLFAAGLSLHVLNLSFFFLFILALLRLRSQSASTISLHKVYLSNRPLNWAMGSMLIALLISQLGHGYTDLSPYNPIARLSVFIFIFWLLRNIPLHRLRTISWAWVIGAMACAIQIHFTPLTLNLPMRPEIENWYVALSSLLGALSVISLAWYERPNRFIVTAHLAGGACGLYTIYLCQTRGVWIAVPLFMVMVYLAFAENAFSKKNIAQLILALMITCALFFSSDLGRSRIQQAVKDVQLFEANDRTETSVGTRFILWEAAWIMITEHPLIGVGPGDHYKAAMTDLVNRKILTSDYHGAHSHNEILYSTATMGIPGLLAILLTYLVPGYYFGKNLLNPDRQTRAAAAMGFSVCAGFMIFGLVDVLFKYKETEVFYCVTCAVLFAFMFARKEQQISAT